MSAEAKVVFENLDQASARQEVAPAPALATLAKYRGPVVIDLDETLYLRNSTEDFIDSVRPALFGLLIMRLLDVIAPWRWTGGLATRDVWRVRTVMVLFPWTRARWARRVAQLAATETNGPLLSVLNERAAAGCEPPIIATIGFEAIVGPLIAAMNLPNTTQIIAARHTVFADRVAGKLSLVHHALGLTFIRSALCMTDSLTDAPLLNECGRPLHTAWPLARFRPAFSQQYLPGQYLSQVKRPREHYIRRGILMEDYALWVLASLTFADGLAQPLVQIVGLMFLLVSFWAVYETGYVDNDRIAEHFEREPKLSAEYRTAEVATPRWTPWVWAVITGAIGVVLLRGADLEGGFAFAGWLAALVATYSIFLLYNRLNKSTRVWWYAALQMARSAIIVVVVPVSIIGAVAMAAHTVSKWVPYYIYRTLGKGWPLELQHSMPRLVFFVVMAVTLTFAMGFALIWNWSAALLLAWCVFRARGQLIALRRRSVEQRDNTFREHKGVQTVARGTHIVA